MTLNFRAFEEVRTGTCALRADVTERAWIAIITVGSVKRGRVRAVSGQRVTFARDMTIVDGRAEDVVAVRAGTFQTRAAAGAQVVIVADGPIIDGRMGASPVSVAEVAGTRV